MRFEQLILQASTLPQGATLEQHMNNLNAGGTGGGDIYVGSPLLASIDSQLTAVAETSLTAEIDIGVSDAKISTDNSAIISTGNEATTCQQ